MRDVVICDIVLSNFSRNHMCDHVITICIYELSWEETPVTTTIINTASMYNYEYNRTSRVYVKHMALLITVFFTLSFFS